MTNEDIARAIEDEFYVDRKAVSSVIEAYINRQIDHAQLNKRLTEIIMHQHSGRSRQKTL